MTAIEEKKIAEENGYEYIPPYKLNEMMKLSSKIVKLLTDNILTVTLSYNDMKIVMDMVDNALEYGIKRKEK